MSEAGEGAPKGAEAREQDLDVLVALDEPESLIRELVKLAEARSTNSKIWETIASMGKTISEQLDKLNEPKPRE